MKHILPSMTVLAALTFAVPAFAAEKKSAKPAAVEETAPKADEEKPTSTKPLPYRGTVAAVDAAAKTFTTKNKDGKENVFHVTDKTVIMKDKSSATFADIKEGEAVRGTRIKKGDQNWEAVKVLIGAKAAAEPKTESAKPTAEGKKEPKM